MRDCTGVPLTNEFLVHNQCYRWDKLKKSYEQNLKVNVALNKLGSNQLTEIGLGDISNLEANGFFSVSYLLKYIHDNLKFLDSKLA